MWRRRTPLSLLIAILLYGVLSALSATDMGIVGEVAIGWALDRPPQVLVSVDPVQWADGAAAGTAGHRAGPLIASQVRPLEQLALGVLTLPLAINQYTSGIPDWPSRLLFLLTGSVQAVQGLHVMLGGLLIVLVHRFLRFHGTDIAAAVAALLLATDWMFLFYKRALGGTELVLQGALLLCLWGLWSRRWGGGRHGLWPLALGAGLGLSAKLTFAIPLCALLGVQVLTRLDRPQNQPPPPQRLLPPAAVVGLCLAPLLVAGLHHLLWVAEAPHVQSHDFPSLQLQRVLHALTGGQGPAREGMTNLYYWAVHPLAFFEQAYGVAAVGGASPWRLVGWLLVLVGAMMGWRDRHPTPSSALLRFMSLLVPAQLVGLWLVARDIHHMAMLAPMVAILAGLAIEQLCAISTPPRSPTRAALALVLALPWMVAGTQLSLRTDRVLAQVQTPTFTESGQAALIDMLREHRVQKLVASDYELYGMIEIRAPDITVIHGWGATSHQRGEVLPALLRLAEGGHFLVVQASAPMVYNLRPSRGQLISRAQEDGLLVEEVAHLPERAAVLYRVEER